MLASLLRGCFACSGRGEEAENSERPRRGKQLPAGWRSRANYALPVSASHRGDTPGAHGTRPCGEEHHKRNGQYVFESEEGDGRPSSCGCDDGSVILAERSARTEVHTPGGRSVRHSQSCVTSRSCEMGTPAFSASEHLESRPSPFACVPDGDLLCSLLSLGGLGGGSLNTDRGGRVFSPPAHIASESLLVPHLRAASIAELADEVTDMEILGERWHDAQPSPRCHLAVP